MKAGYSLPEVFIYIAGEELMLFVCWIGVDVVCCWSGVGVDVSVAEEEMFLSVAG